MGDKNTEVVQYMTCSTIHEQMGDKNTEGVEYMTCSLCSTIH